MANSSQNTGASEEARAKMPVAAVARTELATTAPKAASSYMAPPQGPDAPTRLRYDGSPQSAARLNVAMKTLLDPEARTRPSKVYSGQARNWSR
jgi:hypothetical protein